MFIHIKRFYCPHCKNFKNRLQVRFQEYWIPHYTCKSCSEDVIIVKDFIHEKLQSENDIKIAIEKSLDTERQELEKEMLIKLENKYNNGM